MARMRIDQHDEVVSKAGILDINVLPTSRYFFRPLQHPVYLSKVEVTEQRRNHPALRNALFARCHQYQLQQTHHVVVLDAARNFFEQQMVPHGIKVGA
ncbi:hypothetical protein D9M68_491510 [compost metagenome]